MWFLVWLLDAVWVYFLFTSSSSFRHFWSGTHYHLPNLKVIFESIFFSFNRLQRNWPIHFPEYPFKKLRATLKSPIKMRKFCFYYMQVPEYGAWTQHWIRVTRSHGQTTLEKSYNKAFLFCIFSVWPHVFCFAFCKMTHLQLKGVVPGLVVGTSTCAYCASSGTRIQNFKNKQCLKFSLLLSGQKLQHIHVKRPLFPMLGHSTQEIFGNGNREAWKQLIGIQSGI